MNANRGHTPEAAIWGEPSSFVSSLLLLLRSWKLLVAVPLMVGAVGLGVSYLIAPIYTARTTFLPPQQSGSASGALASLGALAGLAGGATGLKTSGDQYVSLMQSDTVSDRLIDSFKLMDAYRAQLRVDARMMLSTRVRIELGKKDGVISVEVDDTDPERAAAMANRYVGEMRRMAGEFALSEAQHRRVFFEQELKRTRERLTQSQRDLQASGFNPGALRAEPKAAGEFYARLRADVTAAEMRLQVLRGTLAESTLEVQQQASVVSSLRSQLAATEASADFSRGPDYIGRYREFKYQETLFDLVARQYELARLDEAREGALIQVIDPATPPERRTKPKRTNIALASAIAAFMVTALAILVHSAYIRGLRARGPERAPELPT